MKLSKQAQSAITKKDGKSLRKLLAYVLNVHEQTVMIYAKVNANNGLLTTVKAIEAISNETGMYQNHILIDEKAFAA